VRVIDADSGDMLGVMSVEDGVKAARAKGVDLVEVSPNAKPPVCKLLDYGKFKYETQKKKNEAKKSQKVVKLKEIKLRPNVDKHDLDFKKKAIEKFLKNGDKVKVTMRFRGREMLHTNLGLDLLKAVAEEYSEIGKIDHHPKLENRQMIMVLSPVSGK